MKKSQTTRTVRTPRKDEVWVTQKMLWHVRDELKSDFKQLDQGQKYLESKIDKLDAKIDAVHDTLDAKIDQLDAKMDVRFSTLESKLESKMDSHFHQLAALAEEQNARNIAVLDGLSILSNRQDRLESEWTQFKKDFSV